MKHVLVFSAGILFAVGLSLSGMTMPSKVIGFLDVFGQWDISLMFVMAGAIGVYSAVFHLVKPKMEKPVYDKEFRLPTRIKVDLPMIFGAALFGAGWGLGGFCPGPALASFFLFDVSVLVFVSLMAIGMYLGFFIQPLIPEFLYRNE